MKAAFLVIDYVPHQILTMRNLCENYGFSIMAFHVGKFVDYIPTINNFKTENYKNLSKQEILKEIQSFQPDFVVSAGWMIPEYTWICKKLKEKENYPIISQSDTQWYGTIRQRINAFISPFHLKNAFTHLWVAGIYQYEYARKLGFQKKQILLNSLSADVALFNKVKIKDKEIEYPKNFVYIGRFSEEKGIGILLKAWADISDKKGWTLTLIGEGNLEMEDPNDESVVVKAYMDQNDLINELQSAGCFLLPSVHEPWALVIHEAAAAGLPLICTDACGATPHFLISGYNGFIAEVNNITSFKKCMMTIMDLTSVQLLEFSRRSRELGNTITPTISANSLLQTVTVL